MLLSTPLLAIYGAAPFYIFKILSLKNSIFLLLSITISVLFFWVKNYILIYKLKLKTIFVYLISYFLAFFTKYIFLIIGAPLLAFRDEMSPYIIYPTIITIALNTLVIYILFNLKIEHEKKRIDEKNAALLVQNLTAEKQLLKQQLQPHFLFNALSVLKSLIHIDISSAENYVIQLSDFLRYSIDAHNTEKVFVKDEMKFVNDYLALQKIRFENSFSVEINLSAAILEKYIPVFAIQTGIENAFKHNMFTEQKPLKIVISNFENQIKVCNNLSPKNTNNHSGIGLNNLKKRYSLMGNDKCTVFKNDEQFCLHLPIL